LLLYLFPVITVQVTSLDKGNQQVNQSKNFLQEIDFT